ncbi:MAG: CHASE domain-containing protein [Proteobacteria bacterium]|nr:CHASE domain-containing protein [Pseudomonadota bacterium]MDA0914745.1 CHASE domain-containing protein [Pseudomonadota bacterium]
MSQWLVRYPRAIPLLILLIVAVITSAAVVAIESSEDQRERVIMREVVQTLVAELDRRSSTTEAYLRAGSALFAAADDVRLPMFRTFSSQLRLDSNARGSEGIGWAEVTNVGQVEAFENAISMEKGFDYKVIRESGAKETRLVPVTFLKPDSEETRAQLGYDLYSDPVMRAAMDEAARMVRPTATARVVLNKYEEITRVGFLLFMPVFDGPIEARRLKGFIFSPFDAQYFLGTAMDHSAHHQMGVRLFDGPPESANLLAQHAPAFSSGVTIAEQVEVGSRPLVVEIESARAGSLSPLSMATLLFGLALTSLLLLLARLVTRQVIEDEVALTFFEEQNSIRNSLTRELNHRVKNTLASIISIISLTRRRTTSLDDFADSLEGRVRALSSTHDLLTQSEWGTTPLRSVIEIELAPYSGGGNEVVMGGPDIELAPNDALSLGLAIHELATNAAKYGALSQQGGRVSINWRGEGEELVVVDWVERGGPEVSAERTPGFGTDLIQKIVAHELHQPVAIRFDPEGVSCTLRVPLRVRREFQIRERLASLSD